jgi:hypothetical protein
MVIAATTAVVQLHHPYDPKKWAETLIVNTKGKDQSDFFTVTFNHDLNQ